MRVEQLLLVLVLIIMLVALLSNSFSALACKVRGGKWDSFRYEEIKTDVEYCYFKEGGK